MAKMKKGSAVVSEKPSKLSELDLAKFQMLNEKMGRLESQRLLIEKQHEEVTRAKAECLEAMKAHGKHLQDSYGISEEDSINMQTGELTRKASK